MGRKHERQWGDGALREATTSDLLHKASAEQDLAIDKNELPPLTIQEVAGCTITNGFRPDDMPDNKKLRKNPTVRKKWVNDTMYLQGGLEWHQGRYDSCRRENGIWIFVVVFADEYRQNLTQEDFECAYKVYREDKAELETPPLELDFALCSNQCHTDDDDAREIRAMISRDYNLRSRD